jgi:microcystin-dependent protein
MSEPFVGEIRMVGWNFEANGWAFCNGQLLPISQNQALFSLLGTTYGEDGVRTFALPNPQGRVPIHQGTGADLSPYVIGAASGIENVTLLATQMPSHNHLVGGSNQTGTVADPTNAFLAQGNAGTARAPAAVSDYVAAGSGGAVPPTGNLAAGTILPAGGNQPHSNIQPYLCVNFIMPAVNCSSHGQQTQQRMGPRPGRQASIRTCDNLARGSHGHQLSFHPPDRLRPFMIQRFF